MNILDCINSFILFVLGLSTVIGILDYVGFLPGKIRDRLHLNKMDDALRVLQQLGINTEQHKRVNLALKYPRKLAGQDIEATVLKALEDAKIKKPLSIGHQRPTEVQYYYDLIGSSCDASRAKYFAQILSTYWALELESMNKTFNYEYDFIVTPKNGSPLLGYEYSQLVKKPFVLHEENARFKETDDMRAVFDCAVIPDTGSVGLIVDDSTTGGTMVCNTINALRAYGYQVYTCLVVFEPQNKNARERLSRMDVDLLSIVKTHTEEQESNNN